MGLKITNAGADQELAVLKTPNLGANGTIVNNTIYEMALADDDLVQLPKIDQSQITRGKFIGSGAFGEVFEGIATGLDNTTTNNNNVDNSSSTNVSKVAIKTLKKRESSIEFLKEALAVSQLKHENIVEFLGVCLDSNLIILELMEGGELLTYLKSMRRYMTLWDLVDMSHDVAKGCAYLERMRFVHRDLAARNCLLTSTNPQTRKVKIGDFGLARDVYKNDYYRGGGYLPVKWMSPESLMEHKFSIQSDVWSFAVLIWEIMTLGQRPYQEKSNNEVKNFVCHRRGHLDVPPLLAPLPLANELVKCWAYDPQDRPSFDTLLKEIKGLLVFKDELQSKVCCRCDPSLMSNGGGTSKDTNRTFAMTLSGSQATTIPCPQSPTSCSSLPLPPDGVPLHQYMWPRNPCCDVSSIVTQATSSSPQNSSSQNYLRLLPKSKENSAAGVTAAALSHRHCASTSNSNTDDGGGGAAGYVSPRPGSVIQCGCQNDSTQYQNLTDHSCEEQASTSSFVT